MIEEEMDIKIRRQSAERHSMFETAKKWIVKKRAAAQHQEDVLNISSAYAH